MFGAIDAISAPAPSRNGAKPLDLFNAQPGSEQAASAPNPASFFPALQPTQPNLQKWLDNWFGPGGRVNGDARETSEHAPEAPAADDGQLSPVQQLAPPNPPSDIPEAQPAELLTPEQIAQRYDDIQIWLAANPGTEQGSAGASGSPVERNPFSYMGAGSTGDSGFAAMPGFGQSPGMAALGGQALQGLQGLREGYTGMALT
jgi:hypothetical protein